MIWHHLMVDIQIFLQLTIRLIHKLVDVLNKVLKLYLYHSLECIILIYRQRYNVTIMFTRIEYV